MRTIQTLREQRNTRAKQLRDLLDANPGSKWNADHQSTYDAGLAEIATLDDEIVRNQKVAETINDNQTREEILAGAERLGHAGKSPSSVMFAKWLRGGDNALSAADWQDIRNTMSTTSSAQGGYSVQSDVAQQLIDSLKVYGGMRAVATQITTAEGNPLSFPTSDGTAEVGELIAENTTATAADPTFGTIAMNCYKFSSKIVAVPFELLQDSQVDIEAFIRNRLVDRIGRITNTYLTTGTGTAQPGGVNALCASGKVGTSGQTLTVIFDDLIDLIHSVDPAYRAGGACGFMMSDSAFKVVRKLKDTTNNRPLFIPGWDGLGKPMPDTILGYPVTINQDVPVMAANAKSIMFGDFSKYLIRDAMQASLFRFTDSAYAKLGQVGFLMWMRCGGNLLDTAAVKYYQNSAT